LRGHGELLPCSKAFRPRRAAHNVRFRNTGIKRFHHPVVGDLVLSFDGETVSRHRPEDGRLPRRAGLPIPRRAEPARQVVSTLDQAKTANAVDGL
jgi:hypothetical protein